MKRLALVAATTLLFGAAGCGSKSTPTAPERHHHLHSAALCAERGAAGHQRRKPRRRGTAVITVNKATNKIDFSVSLNSFPGR